MSIRSISVVWEDAPYEGATLLVLLALADYADDRGYSYPSINTLAEKARTSEATVHRALRQFSEDGWVVIELRKGPHRTNRYRVPIAMRDGHASFV